MSAEGKLRRQLGDQFKATVLHISGPVHLGFPDAGPCECFGWLDRGPEYCTCWVPVFDLEQQPIDPTAPMGMAPEGGCHDCAYRPGSPERAGKGALDTEDLDALVEGDGVFACHQGIRRPAKWVHPNGMEHPGSPLDYTPPMADLGPFRWAYKADGTPADLCSGWAQRRARQLNQEGTP